MSLDVLFLTGGGITALSILTALWKTAKRDKKPQAYFDALSDVAAAVGLELEDTCQKGLSR